MANKLGIRPFGLRDKLCYASGDLANDCTFILSSTFLMKFYTDVMGVDAYIIGIMMMVARVVDAFTDMTMGRVLDLSKPSKNGKFRPWILRAGGLVAVMSFLLYPVWFKNMAMSFKLVWMFASYLLWGSVFYTMVNIPYSSMASAITDKPEERTQLSVFRNAGATIANLVITAGIPLVVYYTNEQGKKVFNGGLFSYVAAGFSVAAIVFYLVCYFGSTERIKIEPPKKDPNGPKNNVLKNLVTNRSLLAIIVAAICLLLAQLTISGMAQYVYPNFYGSTTAQSTASLISNIGILVISAPVGILAAKFGKKEMSAMGTLFAAVVYLICFLVRPENVWVYVAFYVVAYLGLGVFNILIWACIIDVIDAAEVKNHVREDGTVYACYSFARKLGQAASAGLTGALITAVGYTEATAYDPDVVNGIFNISCLVPAAGFLLVALALIFLYPLNKKQVEANCAELARRRDGN